MGGAVSADVRDGSAVFYNPAGLSFAQAIASLARASRTFGYHLEQGSERARLESLSVFEAAIAARGEVAHVPVAFGLALALPNGHLSKMRSLARDRSALGPLRDPSRAGGPRRAHRPAAPSMASRWAEVSAFSPRRTARST